MKPRLAVLLAAIALLAFGCASHPVTFRPNAFAGKQRLFNEQAVHAALSSADAARVEPLITADSARDNVETGPIWARAFIGAAANTTAASVSIDSTHLVQKNHGFSFKVSYTYTASATLTYGTARFTLNGSGACESGKGTDSYSAMRQAIEICIAGIAAQAAELMRTQSPYARVEIPFEDAPFQPYAQTGRARLSGQAIGRIRGGLVELMPYVGYMKARDEAIAGDKDPGPRDHRLAHYTRQCVLDAQGHYDFPALPAGDYMLICRFLAGPEAPLRDDTEIARAISLGENENKHFVLTPY
ncbi:MAG: hypothetical protein LBI02_04165 [Opitutaceae bacterium]|nr:hypothetical protein [Opitutaceae bacterium]